MAPTSSHLPTVAGHISNLPRTPDIMFIQEIQDNSGPTNDGTVDANVTLTKLVNVIAAISNVTYQFASVNPVDGQDGGQPGGNIRTAFL
jgi:predicted extracellular nuclease